MGPIERHLKAGDVDGACAVYTDDIVHDAVGFPGPPLRGVEAARGFYEHLTATIHTTGEETLHRFVTEDGAIIIEANMTADVIGEFLGIPGRNREITFRIMHVFAFRDSLRRVGLVEMSVCAVAPS